MRKSKQEIADEFVIEFIEWVGKNTLNYNNGKFRMKTLTPIFLTSEQLLERFKKEKNMNLENEFIPHEQALDLKELGFDEPCMAYYRKNNPTLKFGEGFELVTREEYRNVMHYPLINSRYVAGNNAPDGYYYLTTSPTFSQAFRWFREKYGIFSSIWVFETEQKFFIEFGFGIQKFEVSNKEEVELECLKKLIEIVKSNKI